MQRTLLKLVTARREPLAPGMSVLRAIPSIGLKFVGPFIFLDHFGPAVTAPGDYTMTGTGPHPHRGFITLSYIMEGEMEHRDSRGHQGIITGGGLQWMKAASGIQHDEKPTKRFLEQGGTIHGLQLWINLPAARKGDEPEYLNVPTAQVPEVELPNGAGILRVLVGEYEGKKALIPEVTPTFAYHVKLHAGQSTTIDFSANYQVGVYVTQGQINIGDETLREGQIAAYTEGNTALTFTNTADTEQNIIIIGGQALGEPMASYGPFVMNTQDEITTAVIDFEMGKYGEIVYS